MFDFDLQLFAIAWNDGDAGTVNVNPVNKTSDLSQTMKTFYDTALLENAREAMLFTQFGKKQPMKGNSCEWRKFNTFAKATTPLTEGVIPTGKSFGMTAISVSTNQYGDYTAVSDRLELEAYDDVIFGATEEMGAAEGETFDVLTRNVLVAGNSRMFAPIQTGSGETVVASRGAITNAAILTPKLVAKAATWLKKNKAPLIDGSYVAIIHPSQAFDLRQTDEWKEYHKYNDTTPIFKGEIGELHGVRFIESNNTKIWTEGASSVAVYGALFMGKDAFGVLDPAGEGMEMIIKSRSEIGGPLDQFSTIGYKFCHAAKILYQERILRVETGSSFGSEDSAN